MTKILATSKTCGPCFALKNKIEKLGLNVEIREFSPDHLEWFNKHGIRAVPRLVVEDGDNVKIIQGAEDIIQELQNDKE